MRCIGWYEEREAVEQKKYGDGEECMCSGVCVYARLDKCVVYTSIYILLIWKYSSNHDKNVKILITFVYIYKYNVLHHS